MLLWSWRASLNDVITLLERKLANHRSCTIIPPIKSRLSRPNAWSLIDSFPPWLGSTQFWSESQTWRTWKKSLLKAERILRSGDYFLFVFSGEFVVSVKKMIVILSRRFSCWSHLYSSCRFRCWNIEIFRNIRHQALTNNVSFSYRAKYLLRQSVILVEAP